jgi:hypothetical protein
MEELKKYNYEYYDNYHKNLKSIDSDYIDNYLEQMDRVRKCNESIDELEKKLGYEISMRESYMKFFEHGLISPFANSNNYSIRETICGIIDLQIQRKQDQMIELEAFK